MGAASSSPAKAVRKPAPVTLHVYDLGHSHQVWAMNSVLETVGTGAFHCGVEVYDSEWSFQCTPRGTGVFNCVPRGCPSHAYRSSVQMGETYLSREEVFRLVESLREKWPGGGYDMLVRNCCHFCDTMCRELDVGPIPLWTTSLAGAGAAVKDAYDVAKENLYPTLLLGCFQTRQQALAAQGFDYVPDAKVASKMQRPPSKPSPHLW